TRPGATGASSIESHDLALRVEEAGQGEGRAGGIERRDDAVAPEVSVVPLAREVDAGPLAAGVDPVDAGVALGARYVELRELAPVHHEAVRAVLVVELAHDAVHAIPVCVRRDRPGHVELGDGVLCSRPPGSAQDPERA